MPLVNIKGINGDLTLDQKKELISKVTDAVLSVEGEGLRQAMCRPAHGESAVSR